MESMQTLQKLIDLEKKADAEYAAAEEYCKALESRIEKKCSEIEAAADAEVRAASDGAFAAAAEEADERLEAERSKTGARIRELKAQFTADKEGYVDTLFGIVTGGGDGQG